MSSEYISDGEAMWLSTVGATLGWGLNDFMTAKKFVGPDTTVEQLENLRAGHINQIREGVGNFNYLRGQKIPEVYSEVILFRLSRLMENGSVEEVNKLTPDDRQKYDSLMEFATAVAFADVSGILTREEIEKVMKGEKVSEKVAGRKS